MRIQKNITKVQKRVTITKGIYNQLDLHLLDGWLVKFITQSRNRTDYILEKEVETKPHPELYYSEKAQFTFKEMDISASSLCQLLGSDEDIIRLSEIMPEPMRKGKMVVIPDSELEPTVTKKLWNGKDWTIRKGSKVDARMYNKWLYNCEIRSFECIANKTELIVKFEIHHPEFGADTYKVTEIEKPIESLYEIDFRTVKVVKTFPFSDKLEINLRDGRIIKPDVSGKEKSDFIDKIIDWKTNELK